MNYYTFYKAFIICTTKVILLNYCTEKFPDDELDVTILEEITLDSEATQYISHLYPNMTTAPRKEYLAISNRMNPANIILTDFDGNMVERIGSQGRGPEELVYATDFGFSTHENNVVVHDRAQSLIKSFHADKDTVLSYEAPMHQLYITSINLSQCRDSWFLAIDIIDEDNFQGQPNADTPIVGVFDHNFDVVNTLGSFDPYLVGKQSVHQEPVISVNCEAMVAYTTHGKIPYIQIIDLENDQIIDRIDRIPPSYMLSDEFHDFIEDMEAFNDFLIDEQSVTHHISHTDDYLLLSYFNETEEHSDSKDYRDRDYYVVAYDREELTYHGETAIKGAIMGSTHEGHLIELIDDNPENFTVRFFDIKTEE